MFKRIGVGFLVAVPIAAVVGLFVRYPLVGGVFGVGIITIGVLYLLGSFVIDAVQDTDGID